MLGHLELLPGAAAADAESMFSQFPRLGSETPTGAGTDIGERLYSILSFYPRHAQWVGTFGNRVRLLAPALPQAADAHGLQVDLNLFKVQREQADAISSADASTVHNLNTDVRTPRPHHVSRATRVS